MIKTYCLMLSLVATTMMSVAEANLISNGGFETGDFTSWTQFGNTEFSDVDSNAHSGINGAFFGPTSSTGGIEQSFATVIGQVYNLDFWLENKIDVTSNEPNSFNVSVNDISINQLSLSNAAAFSYNHFTASFIADSAATKLTFTFRNDPGFWYVDDISVNVPEPGTWTLLGMGLLALSMSVRSTRTAQ